LQLSLKSPFSRVFPLAASLVWLAPAAFGDDGDRGRMAFGDSLHDFGSVYRGETLTYRFAFTNTGKGPVTIQGVHAACGCTAVEVAKGKQYQPGESGVVEVKLDTTDFEGALQKAVVVMSNERLTPDRTLTLKAFVKSEVEAMPPLADFGEVVAKDGAVKTVRIKPLGGFKLAVKDVEYNSAIFDVTTAPSKDTAGEWTLEIRLKPNLAPGFLKEQLIVRNNSAHLAEMPLPVRALIKGQIEFSPQYVEFGAIAPREKSERSITLRGVGDFDVAGSRAELTINGRRVDGGERYVNISTLTTEKEKKLVAIELKNPDGLTGSVHGKLFFATSDPAQRELAVDFYAFFR
jgi:hypothetical protein